MPILAAVLLKFNLWRFIFRSKRTGESVDIISGCVSYLRQLKTERVGVTGAHFRCVTCNLHTGTVSAFCSTVSHLS